MTSFFHIGFGCRPFGIQFPVFVSSEALKTWQDLSNNLLFSYSALGMH